MSVDISVNLLNLPERTVVVLYPQGGRSPYRVRLQEANPETFGRAVTVLAAGVPDFASPVAFRDPDYDTFVGVEGAVPDEPSGSLTRREKLKEFSLTLRPGSRVHMSFGDEAAGMLGDVYFDLDRVEVEGSDPAPAEERVQSLDDLAYSHADRIRLQVAAPQGVTNVTLRPDRFHRGQFMVVGVEGADRTLWPSLPVTVEGTAGPVALSYPVQVQNGWTAASEKLIVAGPLSEILIWRGYYAP